MATYVYEADIEWVEDEWIVTPQAFPGCFGGGASIQKACESASIALRLFILCVDVDKAFIEETRVDAVS